MSLEGVGVSEEEEEGASEQKFLRTPIVPFSYNVNRAKSPSRKYR
jgi:hypothetical protein